MEKPMDQDGTSKLALFMVDAYLLRESVCSF